MVNKLRFSRLANYLTTGWFSACSLTALVGLGSAVIPKSPALADVPPVSTATTPADLAIPRYDHIIVIIEENKSYQQVINQSFAPNTNNYAKQYGVAINYYGVVHPSEGNYVAMIGGSTFGIHDDDAYYCTPKSSDPNCGSDLDLTYVQPYVNHTINSRNLVDQLEDHGLTWKGYYENLPAGGYTTGAKIVNAGPNDPNTGRPVALYAAKHNGFINFADVQNNQKRLANIVDFNQLDADLQSGNLPNFSHIVPNQCNEMHGASICPAGPSGTSAVTDPNLRAIVQAGDTQIGTLVNRITSSSFWSKGNNAIILAWDEDNFVAPFTQGCCGYDPTSPANFGGGLIPMVVITNNGPRGVKDQTPYNQYSLLRTVEDAFGIHEYLNLAGDTAGGVKPMTPLFRKTPWSSTTANH